MLKGNFRWMAAGLGLALGACSSPTGPGDDDAGAPVDAGGSSDAGTDAGRQDAGVSDAGTPHDAGSSPDSGLEDAGGSDAGVTDAGQDAGTSDGGLLWGTPISADAGVWSWVPFPNTTCNDGSPLGIGINPSATSDNLLIYFNGGGACWDYFTCYVAGAAVLGPYPPTQMNHDVAGLGVTDRADPANPFKDWNLVFIPYCTGDVHAGDNVVQYTFGTTTNTFRHVGHANALQFLSRIGPTFPHAPKVMVIGDSAGGAGATINYDSARPYWPNAEVYLVDDSLAFFPANQTPAATMSAELANWNIQPLLTQICDGGCVGDFSQIYPALRARHPADRMALLAYDQDATMAAYYETLGILYELNLTQLASQELHPSGFQTYFVDGTNHTLLWTWGTVATDAGVGLRPWVTQMVNDDAQWTSAGP